MTKLAENNPQGTANIDDDRVLCGVVYTLLNPNKPCVEWCTIEYMHNAWLMNWSGRDIYNIEHGENGFFLTLKAAKMYATKERLCIGNKSKWGISYNAI